ncbi:MAG: hypothetical protein KKF30_18410 [Proteobacteria bacterium]|nr:hypothetical protein [Pseudomonadota bacterium]MBU4469779.1 hypothetical protein [Pseudomonadota bacterium]MCG2753014.1 hypothetical protein [Desulfobacteraceae bacterium]
MIKTEIPIQTGDFGILVLFKNLPLNGRLTHYHATLSFISRMDLTVQTLDVTQTGGIVVDGRGYLGGYRGGNDVIGQTLNNQDGSTLHSDSSYGSLTTPENLESGGDYGRMGGDGGGRIRILAQNIFLDGVINANGANGQDYNAGSGSGGAVLIQTNLFDGTGIISANGGVAQVGGGGGRIAVYYNTLSLTQANITSSGGAGTRVSGSGCPIYLEEQ